MLERIFIPLVNDMTRVLEHTPDNKYITYVCEGTGDDMNLNHLIVHKREINPTYLELFLCQHAYEIK